MITPDGLRRSVSLAAALTHACRSYPDRVALRDTGTTVTYRQLGHRVAELAAGLAQHLHTRDDQHTATPPVVAVQLPPDVDAVCAVLAVLAAGAAYLPLDAEAPDGYVADLLDSTQPAILIGPRRAPGSVPQPARQGAVRELPAITVPELAASGANGPVHTPRTAVATDPAYVIFTSGTTGRPKGVVLSQAALLHSTAARVDAYGVPDRVPLLHSASVDVYSGVLFWALLTGGTLVVSPAGLRDVPATAELLTEEQVTDLVYLSSLYPVLLEHIDPQRVPTLRRVMIGSDRWSEAVIDRHIALLPRVSLHNEYGPTEAAVWTSHACVWAGPARRRRPLTIGRPVPGTRYHLLDPQQRRVGAGQPGELYISGAQVALGYLDGSQEPVERFVRLPDGQRAFRTGDLAETTPEGEFVFAGRLDRQFKVHGHRIEPAHIESVLMAQPSVGLAHVVAHTNNATGSVLVAYLAPRTPDQPLIADEVQATVASLLPQHMVPAAWVVLAELPRTRSGKIDEAALPAPSLPTQAGDPASRPGDELEAAFADLVGAVLHDAPPAVTTPLTAIGSLALMQIAARIHRELGVTVPVSALFTEPTISGLAAAVRSAQPTDRPPLSPTQPDRAGTPLSAQQQQVWFFNQLDPSARAYNTQCCLYLDGPLDVAALADALSYIVARHEILRSTVHTGPSGGPVQIVHPPWRVQLPIHDLTPLSDGERADALEAGIAEQAATLFDTAILPLVRWTLYRVAAQAWALVQVEHHFVHDGWSAVLLLNEIRDAYAAFTAGRRPALPNLPVQYRDWVVWQRAWLASPDGALHRDYWLTHLAGVAAHGVSFTPDYPRPAQQTFRGDRIDTTIDESIVDALDAVCERYGVTRFAVFLSAFMLLVRQHTSADEIVIGSALANRLHLEVEPLLGMFVNALPLRLTVGQDDTVAHAVDRVMAVLLQAQDHQEYPLIEIIRHLGLARDPARNPLFSLMFAFHDTPRTPFHAAGVTGRLRIEHNGSAKNDVNVVCVPQPPEPGTGRSHAGITVLWEYNQDLFTADTARGLLDGFVRILTTLADPAAWDRPATALDAVDPQHASLVTRLATGTTVQPAHERLELGVDAQIRAHPATVAVVQGERSITYAELNTAASALQAHLAAVGAAAGSRVVLACGPGPDHVAACLAVLRLGAAYVCLDPDEPAARRDTILADAQPAGMVCTPRTATALRTAVPGIPLVITDQPAPTPPRSPGTRDTAGDGGDVAYLVYTSGATGAPKAVVATHTNAVTALTARTTYTTAHDDPRTTSAPVRTLITLPLQFDVASSMIFWTLWTGGTVIFPNHTDDPRDPTILCDLIDRHQVTHLNLVASFYRHLLTALPTDWNPPLRIVAIGGEPCPADLVAEHTRRLPRTALDNEYGPTEATVWCTATRVHNPRRHGDTSRVTVGRPLANYTVHILDEDLRLLPIGARGELCVAGPGVTAGYLNQPRLTTQRFVTPTGGPLAGLRLYRTGDHARRTPTGDIELLGRSDDQVKIRGHRVELGEVTHRLCAHPAVAAAHVLADHPDDPPQTRLVAYVAIPDPPPGITDELRTWASTQLPAVMVPAVIMVVDALPLTAAGKVDRAALPPPHADQATSTPLTDAPVTRVQAAILAVWGELLGHPEVGLDDDWFALGGDSLTAIRATLRLRDQGLAVSVTDLLTAGTVRTLTAHLRRRTPPTGVVVRRPGGTVVPLTAMQAWFFNQHFADPQHFTQARLLTLPGADPTALRRAVAAVADRHDAFRTRFTQQHNGTWTAHLLDRAPTVELVEYHVAPDALGPDHPALTALNRGLDISAGPLWRAALFTDPTRNRRWLYLAAHHLIVDAVSWDILIHDLTLALSQPGQLTAIAPGTTAPLAPPSGEDAQYWERLATTVPPVLGRSDHPRSPYSQLVHRDVELPSHATRTLVDLAHRRRVSILAVLLAALHRALQPLTQASGLYTFLEGHGRDELEGCDQIVGWLTNLYPILLTDNTEERTDLLATAETFDDQLTAVPGGGGGFGLARYLAPHSGLGGRLATMTLPEVTVNYLGHRRPTQQGPISVVPAPTGRTIGEANVLPTALHVTAAIDNDILRLHVSADPARIAAGDLDTACDVLCDTLSQVACVQPLTDTPTPRARPLFLAHPVDGATHWYQPLARLLGPDCNCYAVAGSPMTAEPDLTDMAARDLALLRRVQAAGPYWLAGWSFGAALAFEMALQLHANGEQLDRLVLLDPPPIATATGDGLDSAALTAHLAAILPNLSHETIAAAAALAAATPPAAHLAVLSEQLGLHHTDPAVRDRVEMLLQHHRALAGWTPAGIVDHLILVHSTSTGADQLSPWLALARTTHRHAVPVDHYALIRDPAALAQLAAILTGPDRAA